MDYLEMRSSMSKRAERRSAERQGHLLLRNATPIIDSLTGKHVGVRSIPVKDLNWVGLLASEEYLSNLLDQGVRLASLGQIEESL